MGVSKNRGTPKSSILIGFSIINHPFWGVNTPIFVNTHMFFERVATKKTHRHQSFVSSFADSEAFQEHKALSKNPFPHSTFPVRGVTSVLVSTTKKTVWFVDYGVFKQTPVPVLASNNAMYGNCEGLPFNTVDGRNPANQLVGSLSHYLQGLYIPGG